MVGSPFSWVGSNNALFQSLKQEIQMLPSRMRLNKALQMPSLSVMNFLNEVKINYPNAISFSAGRPAEAFFEVNDRMAAIDTFMQHFQEATALSETAAWGNFGQYGKTNGLICDLLADHLAKDEGMQVKAEDIVVTTGCQEAMVLVLMGLFSEPGDVLLTADPTYIGITGMARLLNIDVEPVPCGEAGLDLDALEKTVRHCKARGRTPKAVYVIPDFNNPIGCDMPLAQRQALLDMASRHDFWVFEDNPYGMFVYDGAPLPTLKSMDSEGRVIYMGTFSKTLFPSLRVGYLATDAMIEDEAGSATPLSQSLSKIKSLTTVNTCAISQAIVGGILLQQDGQLKAHAQGLIDHYRQRRDGMLHALATAFPEGDPIRAQLHWNQPRGGFFMTVTLPFTFDEEVLSECARDFGVIVVPMSYFSLTPGREHQIRLSFCSNTLEEIETGIASLADFIRIKARVQSGAGVSTNTRS